MRRDTNDGLLTIMTYEKLKGWRKNMEDAHIAYVNLKTAIDALKRKDQASSGGSPTSKNGSATIKVSSNGQAVSEKHSDPNVDEIAEKVDGLALFGVFDGHGGALF
jgi:serine/threonine protein phosphatase PrpC